ncbi:MAG TPA: carbonic anhydrase [Ktedonobacterales bacterium]|nr:carbonic anhydrase [Ktedonobacterales bacterium]
MSISVNDLLSGNKAYAASFTAGSLPMPPARKLAVVACMDARLDPLPFLGLHLGDIHVIRNAGGRATEDAIRSLAISERLLGTDAIVVIHHTDCGMLTFSNDDIRQKIRSDLGDAAHDKATQLDFLPFGDIAQSVRDDVAAFKASPLIPDSIPVYGFVYDVRSGQLSPVE